jgi:hypothetical protein
VSVFSLPVEPDVPHQTFQVDLDGVAFGFDFRWNTRAGAWFVQLLTANDDLLATDKMVLGFQLFVRTQDERMPKGRLMALDTSTVELEAGIADLGRRVQVYYFDAAEG